jgi:hypothetical protein
MVQDLTKPNLELKKAFEWQQISCPSFAKMLWHNVVTNVYESGGEIIQPNDKRLIEYLRMSKRLIPV